MRTNAFTLITATALTVGLGQIVYAADMPARTARPMAPVAVAPLYNWTGCYIGGNVGAAWGNADFTNVGNGASASGSSTGFAGGVQGGCDYQAGPFVIGIRDVIDWSSLNNSGTFSSGPLNNFTASSKSNWFDALTGRVGYTVQPNWLLYFQGGAAWARTNEYLNNQAGVQIGQLSNTRSGWTIGGGSEYMLSPSWSAFIEYNYLDFGTANGTVGGIIPVNAKLQSQNVLVGLNWRWSAGH